MGKKKLINASSWPVSSQGVFYSGNQAKVIANCDPSLPNKLCSQLYWRDKPGHYALVYMHSNRDEVIMVRDHFGCQPLYYYSDNDCFIFGSNIPDVLHHLPIPIEENPKIITRLFRFKRIYSDETFYKQVYRAEPGCIITINARNKISKQAYWQLDPEASDIVLKNDKAYLDRFDDLLSESVAFNTQAPTDSLAGEFSGGLDSSSILLTAKRQQLHYPLFMHVAPEGSKRTDDRELAELLLNSLGHRDISYIDANDFNVDVAFARCAKVFAGFVPHIFYTLTQNISQAVVSAKRSIVLSGAGGDQCVSQYPRNSHYLASLRNERGLGSVWKEYEKKNHNFIKQAFKVLQHAHPSLYRLMAVPAFLSKALIHINTHGARMDQYSHYITFPKTVRQEEWARLQGITSHVLRMRIEYSAVLADSMGYEYRYPLLYPKLVNFCFRLPLDQKKRNNEMRYLIRQYLRRHGAPKKLYAHNDKSGGIFPATRDKTNAALAPLMQSFSANIMSKKYGCSWIPRTESQRFLELHFEKIYSRYKRQEVVND